jgi:hypothetical protein
MSDTSAPAPRAPARDDPLHRRRFFFAGIVIDFVLAFPEIWMPLLAHANSPTGQGAGLKMLIALIVLCGVPSLAWSLYNTTRVDIRWLTLLAWSPVILLMIGIPIFIAYA